jgi:hypothetical protein
MDGQMARRCLLHPSSETGKAPRGDTSSQRADHSAVISGVCRFLAEVRDAWRDPTVTPSMPRLRDYPIRREPEARKSCVPTHVP